MNEVQIANEDNDSLLIQDGYVISCTKLLGFKLK